MYNMRLYKIINFTTNRCISSPKPNTLSLVLCPYSHLGFSLLSELPHFPRSSFLEDFSIQSTVSYTNILFLIFSLLILTLLDSPQFYAGSPFLLLPIFSYPLA